MNQINKLLLVIVAAEVLLGVTYLSLKPGRQLLPMPPLPRMVGYNAHTVDMIKDTYDQNRFAFAEDWAKQADVYATHGFYPEALACFQQARRMAPSDGEMAFRHGFVMTTMGMLDEARESFNAAIELKIEDVEKCWYFIGRDYLRQENVAEALEAFKRIPDVDAAQLYVAKLELRMGEIKSARERAAKIARKNPNVFPVNLIRAHIERDDGAEQAADAFRDLAELSTEVLDSPFFRIGQKYIRLLEEYSLGSYLESESNELRRGNDIDQIKARLDTLQGSLWDPQIQDVLATLDYAKGSPERQQARLERIIQVDGGTTYRYWRSGVALSADGKFEKAVESFKNALRMDLRERARDSRDGLIKCYESLGEIGKAKFHVSRFAFLDGQDHLYLGRVDAAAQAFKASVEMNPEYPHAWYYLGYCERLLGNVSAAIESQQKCLALEPSFGRALREKRILASLRSDSAN